MSLRQCIHRGAGEGVQLCTNRAPRVLSNAQRARRARRARFIMHTQAMKAFIAYTLLCPEHNEHYARSDLA